MNSNWFDKKVLVLGLSKSGIAAAKYLNNHGASVFITESRERTEKDDKNIQELEALGIKIEMGSHSDNFLDGSDIAVTSPGIPPNSDIMKMLKEKNIRVISEIELAFLQTCKPFVAITGTNGKTTTTTLVGEIMKKYNNQIPDLKDKLRDILYTLKNLKFDKIHHSPPIQKSFYMLLYKQM